MRSAALSPGPCSAQEPEFYDEPYAPDQWTFGRRLDELQLRYCVDRRDPDWEVAGAIADAIAAALLLEPQRYVVESEIVLEDITNVYAVMLEHCDVHMGFKLIPEGYANWVTLTRAYYETQYVFVTADPDTRALADSGARAPDRRDDGQVRRIFGWSPTSRPCPPKIAGRRSRWAPTPGPRVASQRHGRRRPRLGPQSVGEAARRMPPTPTCA